MGKIHNHSEQLKPLQTTAEQANGEKKSVLDYAMTTCPNLETMFPRSPFSASLWVTDIK